MADVFDFDQFKSKKEMKKVTKENIVYEIFLSTVTYVQRHSVVYYDNPLEYITTDTSLYDLFKGDHTSFFTAFEELIQYWNIDIDLKETLPADQEFDRFSTIGDVCMFIERRVDGSNA
ncbi:hypothetical protein GCM10010954_09230 [Halobacillus andaensis]|uniref:Uncharacterized protein n=1 Tax=Halobacillus andaensis TaxID=1176239 RepID=A0A917AZV9_HALAA|nr:hypothetical protein [Halobacillus andaensis]MBP2003713.1 hypothetical protein [Halobacillus andaensis]GGF12647.1 hypothetical protein GCM10010954_09230 [Halobacillus andaensis]